MAALDPDLEKAIKPLVEFFALGKRPKADKNDQGTTSKGNGG